MIETSYNPDVLTCLANLSNDEVFTPPTVVNDMLDLLPVELWSNPKITFLDPVSKSGVFLREITKRLDKGLENVIPDKQERINHILKNQVFGIAITELTSLLSRRSVYCSKIANGQYSLCTEFSDEQGNLRFEKMNHSWHNGKCKYCGANQTEYDRGEELESYAYNFIHTDKPEKIFNMKFDVIVGNPPYQLSDGGAQASAIPLYHKFIQQSKKLNPRYLTMITPSRWFAGGRGLDDFRDEMINDKKIRVLHDFLDASDCFPGVEIKGGVSYFLWDRDSEGPCEVVTLEKGLEISRMVRHLKEKDCDIFIRYNESISILNKIKEKKEKTLDNQISSQKPFGLRTFFKGSEINTNNSIKVYANKSIGYVKPEEIIQNNSWVSKHKVILPRAIGTGDSKSDLIKPIYSEPGSCCTETYVVVGPYNKKEIAENVITYIQTKFFHFLVTLKKNTMMASKTVYSFVPIQDFTQEWSDEKLYKKYCLTKDEIEFIESLVRPMDLSQTMVDHE
ncbi:MAG: Eco57I restriction-modification methylase domain-containing protein [Flavobacteriia bacterium]